LPLPDLMNAVELLYFMEREGRKMEKESEEQ
jgi:hypothetical protein